MRFCSDDSSERRESSSPIVRWGILSLLVVTSDRIYRLAWRISLTPLWSDATLVTVVRITLASTGKKRKHLTSSDIFVFAQINYRRKRWSIGVAFHSSPF